MEKLNKPSQSIEFTLKQGESEKKTFFIIVPLILLFALPFVFIYKNSFADDFYGIIIDKFFITLPILIAGIVFHELLHGITWAILLAKGFKSIRFGVSIKNFSPYCHCRVPIKLKYYIWGGLMPLLVLGLLPILVSWFTGNLGLLMFGMVFSLAAGSDILICWKLRKINNDIMVQDFPDKTGCFLVEA